VPRRRPRLKARVALEHDGRLLLARHERDDEGFWCLPGGGVEPGEPIVDAALREMDEEAGVEVALAGLIWIADGPGERDDDGILEVVFRARLVAGEATLDPQLGDRSLVGLRWCPASAIPEDFRPAALRERLQAAGGAFALPAIDVSGWRPAL
jgi:ADP-ribose pyrophosphatase YjhB (NUDIX family)